MVFYFFFSRDLFFRVSSLYAVMIKIFFWGEKLGLFIFFGGGRGSFYPLNTLDKNPGGE